MCKQYSAKFELKQLYKDNEFETISHVRWRQFRLGHYVQTDLRKADAMFALFNRMCESEYISISTETLKWDIHKGSLCLQHVVGNKDTYYVV